MKIRFTENNESGINPMVENGQKKVDYDGKTYTYVGKSKGDPATTTRAKALFQCFIMTLASCLVFPCFFKGFRRNFKIAGNEFLSGQEITKYYALNPEIFPQNQQQKPKPTDADLVKKGAIDSDNAQLD